MAITDIHFVYRVTASHIAAGEDNIPVGKLVDETISSYDLINDWDCMLDAFGRINSKADSIAEAIRKREKDNMDAIDNAEPGEEPEELDYDELVEPRDEYIRSMDLDTLIRAYQEANGGPEYCTYTYITDDEEEEDED